jgi:anthranilate synthase component 2
MFDASVLVIDNYDSFTYNLVHLLTARGCGVIVRRNDAITVAEALDLTPDGILISPGPGRPEEAGVSKDLIRQCGSIPLLGVCLGHQAIGEVFGGNIVEAPTLMHGKTSEIRHENLGVLRGLPQPFIATRYHSLVVDPATVPIELEVTAYTDDGVIMGMRHRSRPLEGIQFHPESILTTSGPRLIENWIESLEQHARRHGETRTGTESKA